MTRTVPSTHLSRTAVPARGRAAEQSIKEIRASQIQKGAFIFVFSSNNQDRQVTPMSLTPTLRAAPLPRGEWLG